MDKGRQMRYTDEELSLIKSTFKDNERLLKLLRKCFLPEYDVNAPIGQVVDLWMTLDLAGLTEQEREIRIFARNGLIQHIEHQLQELNILSEMKDETPTEKEERLKKDSVK